MVHHHKFIDRALSLAYKKHGAFYAFSNKQFDERANGKDPSEFVSLGSGLICPKENEDQLIEDMIRVIDRGILIDCENNSLRDIVERELANHECGYLGYVEQGVYGALEHYPVTNAEILMVFRGQHVNFSQPLPKRHERK